MAGPLIVFMRHSCHGSLHRSAPMMLAPKTDVNSGLTS
jgi:hypothetical protein